MAAFNISVLNDFKYNETTHFIDPMEPTYRATDIAPDIFKSVTEWGSGNFSMAGVGAKIDWFTSLDAYDNVHEIEIGLEAYWGRTTLTSSAAPTTLSSTVQTSVKISSTTTAPQNLATSSSGTTTSPKPSSTFTSSPTTASASGKVNNGKGSGKVPRRLYKI